MHIVFVTYNYPSEARPFYGVFVRNLVRAVARTGTKCTVINPVSIFHKRYGNLDPAVSWDYSVVGNPVEIRKPRYLSASSKKIWGFDTEYITHANFDRAVCRTLDELGCVPDVLYAHFVYPSGAVVARLASLLKTTSIVTVGEDLETDFTNRRRLLGGKWDFRKIDGVIAVSKANAKRCRREFQIPRKKILLLPNGVDTSLFYRRAQEAMRAKHGLPRDQTIIAFTGYFEDRKGPNRVLEAVQGLKEIGVVLMGAGPMQLAGENVLFKASVDQTLVAEMLCAADMFVLPTLSEGSCNAIIEAMACGLPIITSRDEFNDDLVDSNCAIRVNPRSISEIRKAVLTLHKDVALRRKMSLSALERAKQFDVDLRARRIIDWIKRLKALTNGKCSEMLK